MAGQMAGEDLMAVSLERRDPSGVSKSRTVV